MLNNSSRMMLISGSWLGVVAVIVAISVALGARLSTSALLVVICAVPVGVALVIGFGPPPPTVAELLYSADSKKDAS
jgi:hypothetical protein